MAQHIVHSDGLYFGMPESEYHADRALGSTDLKLLAAEPADWWYTRMDPLAPGDEDTEARIVGRAVHKIVLEGLEAFHAKFLRHPDQEGLLVTVADIEARLVDLGVKPKGLKANKIQQLLDVDTEAQILDVIKENAQATGRTILKCADYDRIISAARQIACNESLADAFTGPGWSEVSVFWTESRDGVVIRRKARFDRLKVMSNRKFRTIVDLKKVGKRGKKPFASECTRAIAEYDYDVQVAAYYDASNYARKYAHAGMVNGYADPTLVQTLADTTAHAFVFVFWRSDGAAMTMGRTVSPGTFAHENGMSIVECALNNYARCVQQFGLDKPWIEQLPLQELQPEEMPGWYGSRAA